MKFKIGSDEFFKTWTAGHIRIVKDLAYDGMLPYELQRFNGIIWEHVDRFSSLAQAKAHAARQIIEVDINGIPTTLDVKVAHTMCDAFHAAAQSCCKMEAEKYMKLHFILWEALETAGYYD